MGSKKSNWDERFRKGTYEQKPDPPTVFKQYTDIFPPGKALDIATGTGRLSVYLATKGYDVDAIDQSKEGLKIAQERATKRGVEANWIQGDVLEFDYPQREYDLITVRSCRVIDRITDIKGALKPDGVLFYQEHMRTTEPTDSGPSDDRDRVGANEVLRSCLDLTILHYKEFTTEKDHGGLDAYAQLIARNSTENTQPLPRRRIYQN